MLLDTFATSTLSEDLDSLNEVLFFGYPLISAERNIFLAMIADRQVKDGPAAGLFSTPDENRAGLRLFTGERLRTALATGSVLAVECMRALVLLSAPRPPDGGITAPQDVLERARARLRGACFTASCTKGEYAHTSVAWMRYLATGDGRRSKEWLEHHLEVLKAHRDGSGRWWNFPFYYTLLALTEIELPQARREMQYAARACTQQLWRATREDGSDRRRKTLMERVLERC